jgi:hypothetical protein
MKDEEREEYIEEFKDTLERRVLTLVIATFMLAYAGYLVLKICLFAAQVNHINDSEFTYLSVVGTQMVNERKMQLNLALNFLDGSRELLNEDWVLPSANYTCNSDLFLCNLSVASNYSQFEAVQPLLAANAQSLTGIVASVFFAGILSFQFYDLEAMGLQSYPLSSNLIAKLSHLFTATSTNESVSS